MCYFQCHLLSIYRVFLICFSVRLLLINMNFENVHVVSMWQMKKNIYVKSPSLSTSFLPFFRNSVGHLLFWSEKLESKWAKMSFFDVSRILIRKATNYAICMLLQTLTLIWSHNNCIRKISWNLKTTSV